MLVPHLSDCCFEPHVAVPGDFVALALDCVLQVGLLGLVLVAQGHDEGPEWWFLLSDGSDKPVVPALDGVVGLWQVLVNAVVYRPDLP